MKTTLLALALSLCLSASAARADLYFATMDGDVAEVKKLLDSGVPVNRPLDAGGSPTALINAAGFGHPGVVSLLLSRGASVDARDDDGRTALWAASDASVDGLDAPTIYPRTPAQIAAEKVRHRARLAAYTDITRQLLAKRANPNLADLNGVTPLALAAYRNRIEGARALLAGGANPNSVDKWRRTPLEWAAYNGHTALAQLLRSRGARVASGRRLPAWNQRALDGSLLNAVDRGSLQSVKIWLDRGADPNALVSFYRDGPEGAMMGLSSPLLSCLASAPITALLLARGADPNLHDERGNGPLAGATVPVTRLLLARGARPRLPYDMGIERRGEEENASENAQKLRLLLARGASVDGRDEEGETALMQSRAEEPLRVLLAHHAGINARNKRGETALLQAAQQVWSEGDTWGCDAAWGRILLRHGANPNTRDADGNTALARLAEQGDYGDRYRGYPLPFARALLARGADAGARNKRGQSVLQIARHSGARQLAALLKRAGA